MAILSLSCDPSPLVFQPANRRHFGRGGHVGDQLVRIRGIDRVKNS
jgi:hypothetical protein